MTDLNRLQKKTREFGEAVLQGTRRSVGEWAEFIYGENTDNSRANIYGMRHRLLKHGLPIAIVDGMVVDANSQIGYARTVAGRNSRMVSAYGRSLSLYATHMVRRFPQERGFISDLLQENIEMLAAIKKVS